MEKKSSIIKNFSYIIFNKFSFTETIVSRKIFAIDFTGHSHDQSANRPNGFSRVESLFVRFRCHAVDEGRRKRRSEKGEAADLVARRINPGG